MQNRLNFFSVRALVAAAVVGASLASSAKICTWTGLGADGKWVTPGNWLEGEVPGLVTGLEDGALMDCDEARFGAVSADARTTVDTTGLTCISNIVFTGGAAAYDFTGATLSLTACGRIEVESGVTTDETFTCGVKIGYVNPKVNYKTTSLVNNGSGLLYFKGGWPHAGGVAPYVELRGSGDIRVDDKTEGIVRLSNYLDGTFRVGLLLSKAPWVQYYYSLPADGTSTLRRIHLEGADSAFIAAETQREFIGVSSAVDTLVTGEGLFDVWNSKADDTRICAGWEVYATCEFRSEARVRFRCARAGGIVYALLKGGGTANIRGGVEGTHREFVIDGSSTLRVPQIGTIGCSETKTCVGANVESIVFRSANAGTFVYDGVGETTDRGFGLSYAKRCLVRNLGSGALELTGVVTQAVDGATLVLDAASAPICFNGTVNDRHAMSLAVTGSATTTLKKVPAVSALRLEGGILALDGGMDFSSDFPPLVFASGDSKVTVPAGASLILPSLARESGRLDFAVPEDASVTIADRNLPGGVTMNGHSVTCEADGRLTSPYYTAWKSATDGAWDEAEKWSAGVPGAAWDADVAAAGKSYAVTMSATPAAVPLWLMVANAADGETATLSIGAPVAFVDRQVTVKRGGAVLTASDVAFTNTVAGNGQLSVEAGGALTATAGTLQLPAGVADFALDGGTVSLSGTTRAYMGSKGGFVVGTGTFSVSDTAKLTARTGAPFTVTPKNAGETSTLTVDTKGNYLGHSISLCSDVVGGCAVLNFGGNNTSVENLSGASPNPVDVGYLNGTGVLNVNAGARQTVSGMGVHAGLTYMTYSGSATTYAGVHSPTGIVNVAGGILICQGTTSTYVPFPCGLVVGDAALVYAVGSANERACGRVNLSAGTLSVQHGYSLYGVGPAVGEAVQTGGAYNHWAHYSTAADKETKPDGSHCFEYPFVLGLAGGTGSYVISNGTMNVKNDAFVGGAKTSDLEWSSKYPWNPQHYAVDNHEAQGLLAVRGGTVRFERDATYARSGNVIVGADGRGTVEAGPDGSFVIDGDLVLSNATASVLRLVTGARAGTALSVGGTTVVTDGAKLVVDLRGLSSRKGLVKLMSSEAIAGTFGTVEYVLPDGSEEETNDYRILYELDGEPGLWLLRPRGFVISIR